MIGAPLAVEPFTDKDEFSMAEKDLAVLAAEAHTNGAHSVTSFVRVGHAPNDFSKMSVQAIQVSRRLARRFGASIHLAHVRQFNYAVDFSSMPYEQNREQTALKELKKVASECGVSSVTSDVLSGVRTFWCLASRLLMAVRVISRMGGRGS
jgi:hypothetical protein